MNRATDGRVARPMTPMPGSTERVEQRQVIGNIIYAHLSGIKESALGMSMEKGIPTDLFNELLERYLDSGWTRIYEYDGPDAWIDYGRVHVRKGKSVLRFLWSNVEEGRVTGSRADIAEISRYVRENRG